MNFKKIVDTSFKKDKKNMANNDDRKRRLHFLISLKFLEICIMHVFAWV